MNRRGDLCWAEPDPAAGSRQAKRRPVLVIQADAYDLSRLATVLVAAITSNTALATVPGNTFLPAAATGLPHDSVVKHHCTHHPQRDRPQRSDRHRTTLLSGRCSRTHGSTSAHRTACVPCIPSGANTDTSSVLIIRRLAPQPADTATVSKSHQHIPRLLVGAGAEASWKIGGTRL